MCPQIKQVFSEPVLLHLILQLDSQRSKSLCTGFFIHCSYNLWCIKFEKLFDVSSLLPSLRQVNGLRVALPHSPSPLISLSLAGQYITLRTPFGLQVRWDGNHYVQISVPRLV